MDRSDSHTAPVLLEMRGITKRFPGVLALDRVDFDLRAGEVHVLLGENGAGKSTLMKILSGAYLPDEGRVLLDGADVELRTPAQSQTMGISTIYQEFNLIPHLSVQDNIFLGREPVRLGGWIDRRMILRETERLLAELDLKIDPEVAVSSLSVAQQQMVEVAKALSLRSRILIMDEPTSALTESEAGHLLQIVLNLKERGVAVVYISHRMEELRAVGDRVTVLRDGQRIANHSVREISIRQLIREMANRDLKEHYPRRARPPGAELLRVEHLSRADELKEISFSLRSGEILGIAGLVGAGRTALARAIFGADPIDSGTISINGKPKKLGSPAQAIAAGVGLLTEDRKAEGLVLSMSVRDNIVLPSSDRLSRWGFMDVAKERELAGRFVRELRIKTPSLDQRVVFLSGGNQQKVVLSKWLGRDTDILIFDEPTRGIDVGTKVEIYEVMNRLTDRGAAILMISSELPEILGMSDRILVMRDGTIVGEFARADATAEGLMQVALGHGEPFEVTS